MVKVILAEWKEETIDNHLLWKHVSGACVYESSFWSKEKTARQQAGEDVSDFPTWKAHRKGTKGHWDEDDDGYIYMSREGAMTGALTPYRRTK